MTLYIPGYGQIQSPVTNTNRGPNADLAPSWGGSYSTGRPNDYTPAWRPVTTTSTNNRTTWPRTTGGRGGGWGRGGGGGGGAVNMGKPGIDQKTFDFLLEQLRGARPSELNLPEMNRPEFYEFNSGVYDRAREGVRAGLAAERARQTAAYDRAATELGALENQSFTGEYATDPGVQQAMQNMMRANDLGQGGLTDVDAEGAQADAAFGNVLALLQSNQAQAQAARRRALAGDQRASSERLGSQGMSMNLGIDMALANAQNQHAQNAWRYGVETADMIYNQQMQQAMANWQAQNDYTQGSLGPLGDWILAGIDPNTGKNVLKLEGVEGVTGAS